MKDKDKMGRREFLAKTALAAAAVPAILQGGLKVGHAAGELSRAQSKRARKR